MSAARPASVRRRASSARTAPPDESSHLRWRSFGLARREMGSSPSHEDDDTSERGAHANITIDVFLTRTRRTDVSLFEPRGLNTNATRCQ
jgi:hypothetical protein